MPRTTTRKTTAAKNRIAKLDGKPATKAKAEKVRVVIPPLQQKQMKLTIIGDRPLLVNNKMGIAKRIADQYGGPGGKSGSIKPEALTVAEQDAFAFYVLPDSKHDAPHAKGRYGVPRSGISKCFGAAIRCTGENDNTTIGLIRKSFDILGDCGGLCLLQHKGFEQDERPVNIGSSRKTVPQMRFRPLFYAGWKIVLVINFNPKVLTESSIVNLAMHAGQYIGLCELRKEKGQGECGGFVVG